MTLPTVKVGQIWQCRGQNYWARIHSIVDGQIKLCWFSPLDSGNNGANNVRSPPYPQTFAIIVKDNEYSFADHFGVEFNLRHLLRDVNE